VLTQARCLKVAETSWLESGNVMSGILGTVGSCGKRLASAQASPPVFFAAPGTP
jgi:hypothetical protein